MFIFEGDRGISGEGTLEPGMVTVLLSLHFVASFTSTGNCPNSVANSPRVWKVSRMQPYAVSSTFKYLRFELYRILE